MITLCSLCERLPAPPKEQARSQAYQDYRAGERNAEAIVADYYARKAMQDYRQGERGEYVTPPPACTAENIEKPKPWWQRAWEAVTHPVQTFENAMIAWGRRSETGRKVIRFLSDRVASLNDPVRNPVTAAFGQSIQDGWAGLTYGVSSTLRLAGETFRSISKGDWGRAKRYGGALLEGTVKGWLWGGIQTTAEFVWGAIKMATPIGLFETIPAWWSAVKEARAGKRGGWDVALTSLVLLTNVLGMYGTVNGVRTANEFRTFQDTLSPSAQSEYITLSTAEQIRLFNAARNTDVPSTAIEFYLSEIGRPASPLAELPLADALKISSLATETGQGPVLLDYISHGELASQPWIEYIPSNFRSKVVPAFEGEEVIPLKLTQSRVAYRYWGGESEETGSPWLTVYSNLTPEQARSLLALPDGNLANHITPFLIPEDTIVLIGKAASQISQDWAGSYALGGGIQIYVPDLPVLIKLP